MGAVETFRGPVDPDDLGMTLIHEHIFVRNPELELNLGDQEWDEARAIEEAVAGLSFLHEQGVRTVVDLTVPGLGRDVELVARVARRVEVNLIAATGWYTPDSLPLFFKFHGPGRAVDETDRLLDMFVRDIREGIAGTDVRAGMLKVATDEMGLTPDVVRIMEAAAVAHQETGVPITTHSLPATGNGLAQQDFLTSRGVDPGRIVIGHSGDSEDLAYLREIMDNGSTLGLDRFGMEHVLSDERRIRTVLSLLELDYADRMVMSQDAAFYSHVTPPSWRATRAPNWRMDAITTRILPALRERGVTEELIDTMLVQNPRRILEVCV